jgi:hypothetical protein
MLIFNTTYVVSDKVHGQWIKWVREEHIPFMLSSALLSRPQVAKVIGAEDQDGTSYSVQFHVQNMESLEQWHTQYSNKLEQNVYEKFGTDALIFATILEIIE